MIINSHLRTLSHRFSYQGNLPPSRQITHALMISIYACVCEHVCEELECITMCTRYSKMDDRIWSYLEYATSKWIQLPLEQDVRISVTHVSNLSICLGKLTSGETVFCISVYHCYVEAFNKRHMYIKHNDKSWTGYWKQRGTSALKLLS